MNPKRLELTAEELARIERTKKNAEGVKVSPEDVFVAEFGYYFGWEAILWLFDEASDQEAADKLLKGARKVWYNKLIDQAYITYTATAASQSGKKARQVMQKGLKEYLKEAKVDL